MDLVTLSRALGPLLRWFMIMCGRAMWRKRFCFAWRFFTSYDRKRTEGETMGFYLSGVRAQT